MRNFVLLFAALLVVGCGEKSPKEEAAAVEPLGDSAIDKALKEAVDFDSLEERESLFYQNNEPFSGWIKGMYDSGQVKGIGRFKDGKPDGLQTAWHENGQKWNETTFKDGEPDGLWTSWYENGQKDNETTFKDGKEDGPFTEWHDNGQKAAEGTYKDGEGVSVKYWNSKGEEVGTRYEAEGKQENSELERLREAIETYEESKK